MESGTTNIVCTQKERYDPQAVRNGHVSEKIKIKHQRCRTTHLVKLKVPGHKKIFPVGRKK